jgi:fused signal recognition particle receptor
MNENAQQSWWKRLSSGLKRSSSALGTAISDLVSKRRLDAAAIEDLEAELIRADLGVETAARISKALAEGRYEKEIAPDEVKAVLAGEIEKSLAEVAQPLEITTRPFVILVIGVNGSGKTTTIGKLAAKYHGGRA